MTKTVYAYDNLGKFLNTITLDETDRSPISGNWQIPANCTETEVLTDKEGYCITWNGTSWEYVEETTETKTKPTLDELKVTKVSELKAKRDLLEVQDVTYNNNTYDFDEKSRDRLDIAYKALSAQKNGVTINWTMANNTTVAITKEDILNVFIEAAERSNDLHITYRSLKEKAEAATTQEELDEIDFSEQF